MRPAQSAIALPLLLCAACGGGGSAAPTVQIPPQPDFTITLSTSSLSLSQGATATVGISVASQNGFTGAVQISLANLPAGVVSNPSISFTLAANANTVIVVGASQSAPTGNFTVAAQATSGALSHSANLSLTIQSAADGPLPRTAYVRTNSAPIFDDPPGEFRHRRIAYDPANKHVFVANRAMNRVEVLSSISQTLAARINVPGVSSVSLSPGGTTLWVGTVTQQAAAIDAATLHLNARYSIPPLSPIPNATFDRPEELLPLANGKIMLRLRQAAAPESLLALWDPATNGVTNLTSSAPQLFQNGLGAIASTAGGMGVLVGASDASGQLAILDDNGNLLFGPATLGSGVISLLAANPDGSVFAVQLVSNATSQLYLLDPALNRVAGPLPFPALGLAFSRDGKYLYASQTSSGAAAISVFDAHTLQSIGQVPDAVIQGIPSEIEQADDTQLLFGIANRGVSFLDAAAPASLPSAAPSFAAAPVAQPSTGSIAGGTSTSLSGQNFTSALQTTFGAQNASSLNTVGPAQLQATSPPSLVNGAVNLTTYFSGGWLATAPDAFSYGPQILEVLPNAGSKAGGDSVQIYGYGFGDSAANLTVQIGAATAAVQQLENITSLAPALGFDATYPFPLQQITVGTPSGQPGKADIVISGPSGSTTASGAYQYLQSVQTFAKPGLYKFLQYDQKRQWLYLSNIDHVDVFDLAAGQFRSAPLNPPGGPPPDAAIRGLSLTPDGVQLVVADFGAQSLYLLNPDTGSGTKVFVGGVAGFLNSGPARVAATSVQTVFVGLSGEGGSSGSCSSCLSQLDLTASPPSIQPAPQPEVTSVTGAPLIQADPTGDHVFLAFNSASGGPVAVWNSTSPNHFATSLANTSVTDVATASDATRFATRASGVPELRDAGLTITAACAAAEIEQIPNRVSVPGLALHPSGALLYEPFLTGPAPAAPPATGIKGGIDIIDAHSGLLRLRLFLPEPLAMLNTDIDGLHGGFLALDENGQKLFALTTSGLSVIQLANVPLGIGTLFPATGAATGGTTLTIRGSGFQSGTKVAIGGRSATTTFKDMNTITVVTPALPSGPQPIVLSNPDGETLTLDAAFVAN